MSDEKEAALNDGRALVVMFHKEGFCLVKWLPHHLSDFSSEIENMEIDHDLPETGVFVVRIDLVDDGEGDYPGTREWRASVLEWRLVTEEEWTAHRRGEWPWDIPATKGQKL